MATAEGLGKSLLTSNTEEWAIGKGIVQFLEAREAGKWTSLGAYRG